MNNPTERQMAPVSVLDEALETVRQQFQGCLFMGLANTWTGVFDAMSLYSEYKSAAVGALAGTAVEMLDGTKLRQLEYVLHSLYPPQHAAEHFFKSISLRSGSLLHELWLLENRVVIGVYREPVQPTSVKLHMEYARSRLKPLLED